MFYGPDIWDPWLILSQIGIMQSSFYLINGLCLLLLQTITQGTQPTLDQLLSPTRMDLDQSFSSVTILSFFLGALICSMVCSAVVERAWQCLDFCGTMYFLHLISCCIYSGFPLEWEWWAANVLSLVIMVLLSEYMLVKKEQQPIEMDKMWKV